ncbi:MAG: hypothetical protein JXM68_04405 [Sedimentisphaerales bacterium]|nr:hypothetical protein [Sedimentisphaerales bacterium]
MSKQTNIIFCNCRAGQQLDELSYKPVYDHLAALMPVESLASETTIITIVDDLCHWAIRERQRLQDLTVGNNIVLIGSCSARAMLNTFGYAGVDIKNEHINMFINYRSESAAEVIAKINKIITENGPVTAVNKFTLDYKPANMAWYPVLDTELCNQCRKCENFCLFGVYKFVNNKVIVDKPTKCKPYCPACARICPQNAVIFPKHDMPEINGLTVSEPDGSDKKCNINLKGPDLMNMLRNRNSLTDKAAELGIPKQVLDALSPDEIHKIINKK